MRAAPPQKQAQLCSPDEEGQPGCQELRSLDATEDAVLVVNTAGARAAAARCL
jgi:hypothetical protein